MRAAGFTFAIGSADSRKIFANSPASGIDPPVLFSAKPMMFQTDLLKGADWVDLRKGIGARP